MGTMVRRIAVLASVVIMVVGHPGLALAATDREGPVVVSFTRTPDSVDVSKGPAKVVVWVHLRDNLSGVSTVTMTAEGADQYDSAVVYHFGLSGPASGTNLDGFYTGTITLPRYSPAGRDHIGVEVTDNAGNDTTIGDIEAFTVTGTSDRQGPVVASFTRTPDSVNVSQGPAKVVVWVHLRDNLSGVSTVTMTAEGTDQYDSAVVYHFTLCGPTSGSNRDGYYTGTITLPRYSPAGRDHIGVEATDNAGNVTGFGDIEAFTVTGVPPMPAPGRAEG